MIIGMEIALGLIGLYMLIKGRSYPGKGTHELNGWPARLVGLVFLLPIPLAYLVAFAVALLYLSQGREVTGESFRWTGVGIEFGCVLGCAAVGGIVSRIYRTTKPV